MCQHCESIKMFENPSSFLKKQILNYSVRTKFANWGIKLKELPEELIQTAYNQIITNQLIKLYEKRFKLHQKQMQTSNIISGKRCKRNSKSKSNNK